ncbi:IPT/TIG domain-containing protein [Ilyomonas limi]|nr:IPT/TIG domain-containing protein [Ilyomonas limi]
MDWTTIPYKNIILILPFLCCRVLFAQTTPTIFSLFPNSGPIGTTVTIKGNNFSTDPASNIVYFGAVRAPVVSAATSALEVTVPAGATYQPVTVTTNRLTAYSNTFFNVTFPTDGSGLTPNTFVKQNYEINSEGLNVAIGDLNDDSKADIIVSTGDASQTFINTSSLGMISLKQGQNVTAGRFPLFTTIGDLNGDGKQDIAVVNLYDNTVSVSQNISENGNFSLNYIGDLATSYAPNSAAIADLDADGKPELIVSSFDTISIFKNTGNGKKISFSDRQDLAIGRISGKISIIDLDYDNRPELIVSSNSQVLVVQLLYDGRFIIGDINHYDVPGEGGDTYLGDVDGDGRTDVVVNTGNTQAVLLNQSSEGKIDLLIPATVIETGSYIISLSEMDGDGKVDLCTLGLQGLSIYRNQSSLGNVSFGTAVTYKDDSYSGTAGDIDGDGKPDVVTGGVVNEFGPTLFSIWRNTGTEPQITSFTPISGASDAKITITGRYLSSASQVSFGGIPASSFTVIDDSTITAIVANGSSGNVLVQTPYGQAVSSDTFIYLQPPQITSFTPTSGSPGTQVTINGGFLDSATLVSFGGTPAIITFNNDTTIIALVGNGSSGSVLVQTPAGVDSTNEQFIFIPPPVITSFAPLSGPVGTTVTIKGNNFSTDPASNIVYFGAVRAPVVSAATTILTVTVPAGATYRPITVTNNHLTAYSNTFFNVTFPTDGSGLTPNTFVNDTQDYATYTGGRFLTASDFNNDSTVDIIVSTSHGGQTFINTSSAKTISLQSAQDIGQDAFLASVADLNGDGKLDVAIANNVSSSVSVYRNISQNGDFELQHINDLPVNSFRSSITIADLDADGKPELIIPRSDGVISVFKNTGSGDSISFSAAQDLLIGTYQGGTISFLDLDNDNKPELIIPGYDSNFTFSIFVLQNISENGKFIFKNSIQLVNSFLDYGDTYLGDIDGDGKVDIVVDGYSGSSETNRITVLLNQSFANSISFMNPIPIDYNGNNIFSLNDMDGDGKVDLCTSTATGFSIYRNESSIGKIRFATAVVYTTEQFPTSGIACDIDRDGKPDFVASGNYYNEGQPGVLSIWRNTGTEPQVTDFTPKSGTLGTADTIRGRFLGSATLASFGGTNATITYKDDSTIIAIVGEGATGNVLVQTLYGVDSLGTFTYNLPLPQITSFSPSSGTLGTVDTIRGKFLSNATLVSFGGTPATITFNNDSTIIAIVGNGSSGNVLVRTAAGVNSTGIFTYTPPAPLITSFTPTSGPLGTKVTIKGRFFTGATLVSFGGTNASSFTVDNDSIITAIIGNGSTGSVLVKAPGGVASLGQFTYTIPAPIITSFTPTSGSLGTQVTIKGKFFTGVTLVSFGGAPAIIVSNNDSTIIVTVGNGLTGSVLVKTPYGATSFGHFTYSCPINNPKPIITSNFNTDSFSATKLICTPPAKYYRWYFNNNRILNESSDSISIDKVGFYRVETSQDNICWTSSLDYPVLVTQSPLSDTLKMIMYPNPSTGSFNIDVKLPQATGVIAYVTVYDVNGRQVLQTNRLIFFGDHTIIPMTLSSRGTFFVKVSVNGDIKMQTIVIM